MAGKEIEVSIEKNGQVKVHISGVKGPGCMEYAKLFERIVGPIEEEEHTWEYYEEASEDIGINLDGK
jgi:hypothetical protein